MSKRITSKTFPGLNLIVCKNCKDGKISLSRKYLGLLTILTSILLVSPGCGKPSEPDTPPDKKPPTVYTADVTAKSQSTGQSGGEIMTDGGATVTERGICWSKTTNPTIANSKKVTGSGPGIFTSFATGLEAATTYYIRAYGTNSAGTGYGNQVQFTTSQVSANTVTDIEGNVYSIITIGTQVWMAENLKTMHYQNGDEIPMGLNDAGWQYHVTSALGASAIYANVVNNNTVYGKLYNWYAAIEPRKIAPAGWHVPTNTEWTTLTNFLGGSNTAGLKLKEAGISHWPAPNTGATNSSGFTGLPAGYRNASGVYDFLGNSTWWWCTTDPGADNADALALFATSNEANIVTGKKGYGTSVRCIKD